MAARRVRRAGDEDSTGRASRCTSAREASGRRTRRRPTPPRGDVAPSAILATSDVLALGVLDAAAEANLHVPRGLSVVGFDDVPAAAEAGLTTVRQDHHAKGRIAGELLLAALRGERVDTPSPLPHELIVRGSTAAPATS